MIGLEQYRYHLLSEKEDEEQDKGIRRVQIYGDDDSDLLVQKTRKWKRDGMRIRGIIMQVVMMRVLIPLKKPKQKRSRLNSLRCLMNLTSSLKRLNGLQLSPPPPPPPPG